ncbi:MAG: site-specific integrase [Clostridia bacterium]|nr:site-specific integrase [Clostridia bacterium]
MIKEPNVKKCSFTDYRNWVMVNFLLGTGVRISTLVSILVKDIDLAESILKTRHNKNRRQQIVPISRTLNKILIKYLQYRNVESEEVCKYLW